MTETKRPLVTFALFAYNQEKYIREAVQGALAQDYVPLEIILSDDASTDRTYEVMKEMAAAYSGPHKIVLNQNSKNLGIGGHVNRVVELSRGELIVAAAGDDISFSHRVERLVIEWGKNNFQADSIHSSVIRITETGDEIDAHRSKSYSRTSPIDFFQYDIITGASHAWTKRIFDIYGPLLSDVVREDRTIGFRSALRGGVTFVNEPLVKYRLGGITSTGYRDLVSNIEVAKRNIHICIVDAMQNYLDYLETPSPDYLLLNRIRKTLDYKVSEYVAKSSRGDAVFLLKNVYCFNLPFVKELTKICLPTVTAMIRMLLAKIGKKKV